MFIYVCFYNWSEQISTGRAKLRGAAQCYHCCYSAYTSICPKLSQWKSTSAVFFQTQSIWLPCGGRDPSLKLDNSKAPVFSTVTCSLEELQGRMLTGLLLHLYKTLSAEWIQTQTTQICQFLGKATVRFDSVAWKAVKRRSNKSKFCLTETCGPCWLNHPHVSKAESGTHRPVLF